MVTSFPFFNGSIAVPVEAGCGTGVLVTLLQSRKFLPLRVDMQGIYSWSSRDDPDPSCFILYHSVNEEHSEELCP